MSEHQKKQNFPHITPEMFPSLTREEAEKLIQSRFTEEQWMRAKKSFYKTTYPALKKLAEE